MTHGSPAKLMLLFSAPLILANFGQQLFMIVDAIVVGRGLFVDAASADAPLALDIAYHYLFIMSCLLLFLYLIYVFRNTLQGLGNGIAPLLSGVAEFAARVSVAYGFTALLGDELIFFAKPVAWIAAVAVLVVLCLRVLRRLPAENAPPAVAGNGGA